MEIGITASVPSNQTGQETPRNLVMLASDPRNLKQVLRRLPDLNLSDLNDLAIAIQVDAVLPVNGATQLIKREIQRAMESVDPLILEGMTLGGNVAAYTPLPPRGNTPDVSTVVDIPAPTICNNVIDAPDDTSPAPAKKPTYAALRMNAELGRQAIAVGVVNAFLVRMVAGADVRQRNQDEGKGYDWIPRKTFKNSLQRHGIDWSRPSIDAHVQEAENCGFVTCYTGKDGMERIRITGIVEVAGLLAKAVLDQKLPQVVQTDQAGGRDMYIDVSGGHGQATANIFAGYIASKRNAPTIAIATLAGLFNVAEMTIRRWRKRGKVKATRNFAQTIDEDAWIPDYAHSARLNTADGTYSGVVYQRPNTYEAPPFIRQHPHIGQSRKMHHRQNKVLDTVQPSELLAEVQTQGVRNFASHDLNAGQALIKATKAYRRSYTKRDPASTRRDYVRLGIPERRGRRWLRDIPVIWEAMLGDRPPRTSCGDYVAEPRGKRVRYGNL